MSSPEIEEIKSKLNIVDVVSEYVQLKRSGVNYSARCPFHQEKTPSFHVSPARQSWHCFGCNQGGDVIAFVQNIESLTFPEALAKLAERTGVVLKPRGSHAARDMQQGDERRRVLVQVNELAARYYHEVLLKSSLAAEARAYLQSRKFSQQTIDQWSIGYAPDQWDALYQFLRKRGFDDAVMEAAGVLARSQRGRLFDRFRGRIMFPIADMGGQHVGFSARILRPQEGVGKYINSPETPIYSKSKVLFGLYQARTNIRPAGQIVVVEGNVDAIKSHQAGITNVVASSGTAFTTWQLAMLKRFTETLVFAFDADGAGQAAARRGVEGALSAGFVVRLVRLEPGLKDPDEIIDHSPELWREMIIQSRDYLDFYFHQLFDILDASDPQAKKRAVADFLSLLLNVTDPIVTAHYVRAVAQSVGVRETVIAQLLASVRQKSQSAYRPSLDTTPSRPSLPPRERTEQRFVGLLFALPQFAFEILARHVSEQFSVDPYPSIVAALLEFTGNGAAVERAAFVARYPEHALAVDRALFIIEAEQNQIASVQELEELSRRIRLDYYRGLRSPLTRELALAEQRRDVGRRRELSTRYAELTREIAQLELTSSERHGQKETET